MVPFATKGENDNRRDTQPELLKAKVVVIVSGVCDGIPRMNSGWGYYVIIEPSMLVICYDEQALFPVRRTTYRLVNILEESLPARHIVNWMLRVAAPELPREGVIVWFYEYVGFREVRIAQILLEELELPEVFVVLGAHSCDGECLRKVIVAVDHPIVPRIVELVIDRSVVELEPFVQY